MVAKQCGSITLDCPISVFNHLASSRWRPKLKLISASSSRVSSVYVPNDGLTAGLDIHLADNDFLIDLPAARFSDLYDIKLNLHSFHAIAQVQFPCP
jgi:hypothetical protein